MMLIEKDFILDFWIGMVLDMENGDFYVLPSKTAIYCLETIKEIASGQPYKVVNVYKDKQNAEKKIITWFKKHKLNKSARNTLMDKIREVIKEESGK